MNTRLKTVVLCCAMLAVMSGCAGKTDNTAGKESAANTKSAASIGSDTGNGDIPYWNGLDFGPNLAYAEEAAIDSASGEYLNPAEGAILTFNTMWDQGNIPEYSDDTDYTMVFVEMMDVDGEECYVYRLDISGSDTLGAAYAYAYESGNIYMEGYGGQWVTPVGD